MPRERLCEGTGRLSYIAGAFTRPVCQMLTGTLRPSHVSFACLWSPELGAAATNWVLDRHPCTVPCWEDRACCNERSTFGSNRWYGREEERRGKPKGTESVRRWEVGRMGPVRKRSQGRDRRWRSSSGQTGPTEVEVGHQGTGRAGTRGRDWFSS